MTQIGGATVIDAELRQKQKAYIFPLLRDV